jgi:hypothetical protein
MPKNINTRERHKACLVNVPFDSPFADRAVTEKTSDTPVRKTKEG